MQKHSSHQKWYNYTTITTTPPPSFVCIHTSQSISTYVLLANRCHTYPYTQNRKKWCETVWDETKRKRILNPIISQKPLNKRWFPYRIIQYPIRYRRVYTVLYISSTFSSMRNYVGFDTIFIDELFSLYLSMCVCLCGIVCSIEHT